MIMLRKFRTTLVGYSFIFPAIVLVAIFLLYPIGFVIYISFHKWGILGTPEFVGLKNYVTIFHDPRFWRAVLNTGYYMVLAVPAQIGLGLLLAMLVNRKGIAGRSLFRTVYFIPLSISFVAAGIIFQWILTATPIEGFASHLFGQIGIPFPKWETSDSNWAMVAIALMNTWKSAGYAMVIYLAGLQGINKDYYEAAAIDGARSEWHLFRYITWPLLAPTTFLLVISTVIFTVRGFEPIFVMTQGGPAGATTTLVYYLYERFPNTMGVSSAAATFLLVAILLLTLAQFLASRRAESYY
jgi:multiple sugar transport system permease protein